MMSLVFLQYLHRIRHHCVFPHSNLTAHRHSNNWHTGGTQSCLLEIWTSRVRLSCEGPPDQFRKSASSDSFLDVISDGAF